MNSMFKLVFKPDTFFLERKRDWAEIAYSDSRVVSGWAWKKQYSDFQACLRYYNANQERFNCRGSFSAMISFLALVGGITAIVYVAMRLLHKLNSAVPLPGLVAMIAVAVVVLVVGSIVRWVYYRKMDFRMMISENRIDAYLSMYPEIMELAYKNRYSSSDEIPPQPERQGFAPMDEIVFERSILKESRPENTGFDSEELDQEKEPVVEESDFEEPESAVESEKEIEEPELEVNPTEEEIEEPHKPEESDWALNLLSKLNAL
ncbi:hypothetical protein IJF93_01960 [Candidatus Saccharibacteria bacterium]|nr:hypothetical protein [Candidatus Saccharibacteria bacterium]